MNEIPYIEHFTNAAKKHWPEETTNDPNFFLWFIAQAKAESAFDPKAVSRAGACGIMQIMPLTWREIRLYLPHLSKDILDPKDNIEAGIWYDRFCYMLITPIPHGEDRLLMAFAAYNCGPSRILRLIAEQKITTYDALEKLIPYKETVDYVRRIRKYREELETQIR